MSREDELDVALADTAVSAPFVVAGSQRLTEPIKLFLTGAKAATTGQGSSAVNVANYIEIGAGGIQEDALQALLQVGSRHEKIIALVAPILCAWAAAAHHTVEHCE